jgi:GH24 family phage-related lysozyme (muramidase)
MLRWDHAGGKVIPGLSIRRDQEYRVCLDGAEQ